MYFRNNGAILDLLQSYFYTDLGLLILDYLKTPLFTGKNILQIIDHSSQPFSIFEDESKLYVTDFTGQLFFFFGYPIAPSKSLIQWNIPGLLFEHTLLETP